MRAIPASPPKARAARVPGRVCGMLLLIMGVMLGAPERSELAVQVFRPIASASAVHFLDSHKGGALLDGPAVVSFVDGSCWSGAFSSGRPEGTGLWSLPDGSSHAGTFAGEEKEGIARFVLSGHVLLTFQEGAAFEGDFSADVPLGEGEYVTAEGVSYHGEFAYGRPSGQGRYACLPPPAVPASEVQASPVLDRSKSPDERLILISIRDCRLYLLRKKGAAREVEREYAVATVKRGLETPLGEGRVTGVELDPWWYPTARTREFFHEKKRVDLPAAVSPDDPRNFMGAFKIRLSHATSRGTIYRIHGNNDPSLIGKRATGGCIRMDNAEGEELARAIAVGTRVIIEERADVREFLRSGKDGA